MSQPTAASATAPVPPRSLPLPEPVPATRVQRAVGFAIDTVIEGAVAVPLMLYGLAERNAQLDTLLSQGAILLVALPFARPILLLPMLATLKWAADSRPDLGPVALASFAWVFTYAPAIAALTGGRTLGKWAAGTCAASADGRPLSAVGAAGREFLKTTIMGAAGAFSFSLAALWNVKNLMTDPAIRAGHDLLAGTMVVAERSAAPAKAPAGAK